MERCDAEKHRHSWWLYVFKLRLEPRRKLETNRPVDENLRTEDVGSDPVQLSSRCSVVDHWAKILSESGTNIEKALIIVRPGTSEDSIIKTMFARSRDREPETSDAWPRKGFSWLDPFESGRAYIETFSHDKQRWAMWESDGPGG